MENNDFWEKNPERQIHYREIIRPVLPKASIWQTKHLYIRSYTLEKHPSGKICIIFAFDQENK